MFCRDKTPAVNTPQPRKNRRYPVPLLVAADRLSVSYTHLWLVLNGQRKSARLTARYRELVRNEAAEW